MTLSPNFKTLRNGAALPPVVVRLTDSGKFPRSSPEDRNRMLKYGQQYIDKGAEYYERRNRQQQIEFLCKKAARLGLQLTPARP